jgi:CheY-like chemotaxis protein
MKKELFIIDDDPIQRIIISKMVKLVDSSLEINQIGNGEKGLDKLEKIKNSNHPVILILDINMPVLDGWGFLDKIEKANFYNLPQLFIYMVSSSTDEIDIVKAQRYSFVKRFLHKPLSKKDISAIINLE